MEEFERPPNWTAKFIHFALGILIGAATGVSAWAGLLPDSAYGWILVALGAGSCGIAGALWGDAFWRKIGRTLKYWWHS